MQKKKNNDYKIATSSSLSPEQNEFYRELAAMEFCPFSLIIQRLVLYYMDGRDSPVFGEVAKEALKSVTRRGLQCEVYTSNGFSLKTSEKLRVQAEAKKLGCSFSAVVQMIIDREITASR